jgi:Undecaprenyl-phosphate galactose phosphotransferase WbaP
MALLTAVPAESPYPLLTLPQMSSRPWLCSLVFLFCDLLVIGVTGGVALYGASMGSIYTVGRYCDLLATLGSFFGPTLGIFLGVFVTSRLYPAFVHNPVAELHRISVALTMSFAAIAWSVIVVRGPVVYPARALFVWWLLALIATPWLRSVVRERLCRRPWWGIPVAVFHTGESSSEIIRELQLHPEIGLRPVAVLSAPLAMRPRHGVPVFDIRQAPAVKAHGVKHAMVSLPDIGAGKLPAEIETFATVFPHLKVLHGSTALYNLSAEACQLGGYLAVEVRRDLLLPLPRMLKRALDLMLVVLVLPGAGLAILILSVLVRLESPGPVFFGHRRVGRGCASIRVWKLRTMRMNGEDLLKSALAQDGSMREEWLRNRKLRRDPRLTRVGRMLRRASLDELPQLWNVLLGEMSLVGPRPIVEEEIATYGRSFSLYCRVAPGITGLWQVSGRNAISVPERVRLDSYYVHNWSPWLDLHILARTARAVLSGQGAY